MNFKLEDRAQPAETPKYDVYPSAVFTDEEREKFLIGYEPLAEDAWPLLRPKTHVRYITTAGKFCRGGFVHNVKNKGKPMIFLETGFDETATGYKKWPVAIESISKMWKKRTVEDVQIAAHGSADPRILALEQMVQSAMTQIEAMQEDNKKILNIISKLNEKIVRLQGIKQAHQPPLKS